MDVFSMADNASKGLGLQVSNGNEKRHGQESVRNNFIDLRYKNKCPQIQALYANGEQGIESIVYQ